MFRCHLHFCSSTISLTLEVELFWFDYSQTSVLEDNGLKKYMYIHAKKTVHIMNPAVCVKIPWTACINTEELHVCLSPRHTEAGELRGNSNYNHFLSHQDSGSCFTSFIGS